MNIKSLPGIAATDYRRGGKFYSSFYSSTQKAIVKEILKLV